MRINGTLDLLSSLLAQDEKNRLKNNFKEIIAAAAPFSNGSGHFEEWQSVLQRVEKLFGSLQETPVNRIKEELANIKGWSTQMVRVLEEMSVVTKIPMISARLGSKLLVSTDRFKEVKKKCWPICSQTLSKDALRNWRSSRKRMRTVKCWLPESRKSHESRQW